MTLPILAIVGGFALLVWGADRFVTGAAALARNLGVAPLLIGLTIVGIGTSAPEILVSVMAALQGNPGLAVGNAIGSNIANIGMILGLTALVAPLAVHSDVLRKEYPLLLAVSIVCWLLLNDSELGRLDGLALLIGLVVTLIILIRIGRSRSTSDPMKTEYDAEIPLGVKTSAAVTLFLVGLAVLIGGSRLLVWGAVDIAESFGVSDLVIGLTIVAIGTSLPELAASIASAIKREHDIAIGNVIGSNLYNILAVLSIPGLLAPTTIAPEVLQRDLPTMLALTVALYLMGAGFGSGGRINRLEGSLLLAAFVAYQLWVLLDSGALTTGIAA